jgi:glutathione reductase (NADPH)
MPNTYDAIVIGSGPAGGVAARALNRGGLKVAVADNRPFGGTCPLRGCEPKKVMVDLAETKTRLDNMKGNGVNGSAAINWADMMRFKNSFTGSVPAKVEESYAKAGIDAYHGKAAFSGPNTVTVGDAELTAPKIVIASGAAPVPLNIPGEEHVMLSDDFLDLPELPKRIAFIGGGYISYEFAYVAATAGAQAHVLHRSSRPLKYFDHDLVAELLKGLDKCGVKTVIDAPVNAVEKKGDTYLVHANGKECEADLVVHGAGRVPAVKEMNLEAAGVEVCNGVKVNEYMQSVSNPAVYAAGDVVEVGQPLTPVATLEAEAAAYNIVHGNSKKADYTGIPSALFTHPPLAAVGLIEAEAKKRGVKYERYFGDSSGWSEFRRLGEKHTGYKVLFDPDSGHILGAHVLGHNAAETINIFAMAMRMGKTIDDLKDMIWAYPSYVYTLRYMLK